MKKDEFSLYYSIFFTLARDGKWRSCNYLFISIELNNEITYKNYCMLSRFLFFGHPNEIYK